MLICGWGGSILKTTPIVYLTFEKTNPVHKILLDFTESGPIHILFLELISGGGGVMGEGGGG